VDLLAHSFPHPNRLTKGRGGRDVARESSATDSSAGLLLSGDSPTFRAGNKKDNAVKAAVYSQ